MLFISDLKQTRIVIVGGTNYRLTHISIAKLLVLDDEGWISSITIPKALYFPMSQVNVLSIGQISLLFRDGSRDNETYIKLTYNKSFFS